ncbi:hypothetical protein NHP190012_09740 [Helicobacter sp. NHP19-012]|uniref:Uncharacterized protein n=1 Tax=Helicobacter gastrofelis TaxID=2849642 RepID=A0ABN6I9F6_9HELI|nr:MULTISPECIES: hypothetical protein [unclassified Helicobacter]BCZ19332.1 hypothetical protein NHP190012_09740 [Helicobacter sp. NHP19-012]GMB96104.1 hypothetical protein NHP22001_06930 [Helicobacter sp. NHP22-001]
MKAVLALSLLLNSLLALPTGEQLLREEQVQLPKVPLSAVFFSQKQPYTSWSKDYGVWQTKHILEIRALSKRVHINKITLNRGRCALLPILPSYILNLGEKMDYEVFCEGRLRVEVDTDFGAQIFHLREDLPNDPS